MTDAELADHEAAARSWANDCAPRLRDLVTEYRKLQARALRAEGWIKRVEDLRDRAAYADGWRDGAEAMREAVVNWIRKWRLLHSSDMEEISFLPLPEPPASGGDGAK